MISRNVRRLRRHKRLRRGVIGTTARPRLQFHRTLHHIYATIVDDSRGQTLVAASTRERDFSLPARTNLEAARMIGEVIGRKAKAVGIDRVVFDTSGLKYHGRVAALADAARAAGLEF